MTRSNKMGCAGLIGLLIVVLVVAFIGAAAWGFIIMLVAGAFGLAWGFWPCFGLGVLVTSILGALSRS